MPSLSTGFNPYGGNEITQGPILLEGVRFILIVLNSPCSAIQTSGLPFQVFLMSCGVFIWLCQLTTAMGLVFLAIGLGQGKQKLGSCEESGGTGKKCGSKFIRLNAHSFAEYLVGE